jgi:iduronate 2-sulfatase
MRHGYYANITYMDAQIGKVLAALEKSGVADRTIVVFFADHGYHIGEHSLWGKTSNFDYDAHVPLIIRGLKGSREGAHTAALSELVDLFPTLVDLCGLPMPSGLEGTSLAPIVLGKKQAVKEAAYTQHPRPAYYDREPSGQPQAMGYSVRTDVARYTEWRDWQTKAVIARELYLTDQDPAEMTNYAADPNQAKTRADAEKLLLEKFPR